MNVEKNKTLAQKIIIIRSVIYEAIRQVLFKEQSVEVVTPILCPYPEIAPMAQFTTEHPILGIPAFLRVAPTEFLKRLLVLGADSVFEFSTNFRPEIVDKTHLPEFTSLEVMTRGASVRNMQDLTEQLCRAGLDAVEKVLENGDYTPPYSTRTYRITDKWERVSLREVLYSRYRFSPNDIFVLERVQNLYKEIIRKSPPALIHEATDAIVEAIVQDYNSPVFVSEYPNYLGGPAKPCDDDRRFKERSELFVGTMEIANMSSTLTDPVLLREWHTQGLVIKDQLGISPNLIDEPLMSAIAVGLAPSAVLGLGLERLIMIAANLDDISLTRSFPYAQIFNGGIVNENN